jgi:hypothetical protein
VTPRFANRACFRVRFLGLAAMLLLLPACGLRDYENSMRKTQERVERFNDETKYLDEPVNIPTRKEKDVDMPVAQVFFRPPKGVQSSFQPEQIDSLLWRYLSRGGNFSRVEMAFDEGNKEFTEKVLRNYKTPEQLQPPEREPALPFDVWEYADAQTIYSINILKNSPTQVAVVFVFPRGSRDYVRRAMELSLQSLAVGAKVGAARSKSRKSPWLPRPTSPP